MSEKFKIEIEAEWELSGHGRYADLVCCKITIAYIEQIATDTFQGFDCYGNSRTKILSLDEVKAALLQCIGARVVASPVEAEGRGE